MTTEELLRGEIARLVTENIHLRDVLERIYASWLDFKNVYSSAFDKQIHKDLDKLGIEPNYPDGGALNLDSVIE